MRDSTIQDEIEDNHIQRQLRRLNQRIGDGKNEITDGSFDRYYSDLEWFDEHLQRFEMDATDVSTRDLDEVLLELSEVYHGPTAANRWRSIKRLYESMTTQDWIDENPCMGLKLKHYGISNTTKQSEYIDDDSNEKLYAPSEEEINQMVQHVPSEQDRTRDQLLIRLMYHTGCRCNEIRHIKIDDITREDQEIRLRGPTTKTGKARTVRYGDSAAELLRKWLDDGYRSRRKYNHSPYLFISQKAEKLSKSKVNYIVRTAAKNAGINEVLYTDASGNNRWKITSHTLRHACGTYMVDNDADIYKVSKYLGHSSVRITEKIYVHDDGTAGVNEAHELGPQ